MIFGELRCDFAVIYGCFSIESSNGRNFERFGIKRVEIEIGSGDFAVSVWMNWL